MFVIEDDPAYRAARRAKRAKRGGRGWWNWYTRRRRFYGGASPAPRELRMVSWRRCL